MSHGDDMVFGDVQYREPVRATRPDLDRKLACVAYEVPGPNDLPIFLERGAADAIERHALRDTSVELGGILLGQECIDTATGRPFVRVTRSLEAKHYENTQASFTYTHDSWEEISRERDRLHPDLDIVGWYHTHPDFGIFLSSHDLFIHRNFFAQPLQVAYVVDPIRQTRGFFQWRDDRLDQVGGFYLTADRTERLSLARLANDLESIPHGDGGGGGGGALSPRLEAELIAMLSRPHQSVSSPAAQAQAAATYGALGLIAGTVLAIAIAWLYLLQQGLTRQADAMAKLTDAVAKTEEGQQFAFDSLAARTDPGASAYSLRNEITVVNRKRQELEDQIKDRETATHAIASQARTLAANLEKSTKALDEANSKNKELTAEAADLRIMVKALEKTPEANLARRYDIAWYAAIAGWIVAVLAGLGLVATLGSRPEAQPAPAPPSPGRTDGTGPRVVYTPTEEPPHSIT